LSFCPVFGGDFFDLYFDFAGARPRQTPMKEHTRQRLDPIQYLPACMKQPQ
jgi:hypothetical protein